ncbi:MAG: hypothetical protein HQK60_00130 [Deltaproteobacteria bacterium]|nr:hypothetical protein [Deltaproteobacteria bacterium]
MNGNKEKVKFTYVAPHHLRDCYVNGAWGEVTGRDEIVMHFYSERQPLPKSSAYTFDETGNVTDYEEEPGGDTVRLIQASLVMDLETARAINQWLADRIDALTVPEEGE